MSTKRVILGAHGQTNEAPPRVGRIKSAEPMNGSAKIRAYRARQRAGIAVLKVPVLEYDVVQALIESRRLTVGEALTRQCVEHALAELVSDWTKEWLKIE